MKKYDEELSKRAQILVLNKCDLVDSEHSLEIKEEFSKLGIDKENIFVISTATQQGIKELLNYMYKKMDEIEDIHIDLDIEEDLGSMDNDDSEFEIVKLNKNTYNITSGKLKRIASVTDIRNTYQIKRFTNIMDSMGIYDALKECGVNSGDTIIAAGIELTYDEEYY